MPSDLGGSSPCLQHLIALPGIMDLRARWATTSALVEVEIRRRKRRESQTCTSTLADGNHVRAPSARLLLIEVPLSGIGTLYEPLFTFCEDFVRAPAWNVSVRAMPSDLGGSSPCLQHLIALPGIMDLHARWATTGALVEVEIRGRKSREAQTGTSARSVLVHL